MKLQKRYRIILIIFLFLLLILVRAFELQLFYDPFILYFKSDYLQKPIPFFSGRYLLWDLIFRYTLNMLISLAIIYLAFQNKNFLKFSLKFYFLAFMILSFAFFIILKGELKSGYLFAFYVRRFLIHPIFVLLLLPAFYYKQLTSKEII